MMVDELLSSWILWWAPIVVTALFLSLIRAVGARTPWLAMATFLFVLNFPVLLFGSSLIPRAVAGSCSQRD